MIDNDLEIENNIINTKISLLSEEAKTNNCLKYIISKISNLSSTKIKSKIIDFLSVLIIKEIPYDRLSKKMFDGIPDDILSLRPLLWKISLNYLSLKPDEWDNILKQKRNLYESYKKKYMTSLYPTINIREIKKKDDPLTNKNVLLSEQNYKDKELYININKDILRTKSNMNFVSMPSTTNKNTPSKEMIVQAAIDLKKNIGLSHKLKKREDFETNADVMNRILFIYAKLHEDVTYIQGMNDLLAPIYYCFSIDDNPEFKNYVEADSYMTFEKLMDIIKDLFIRVKDNEPGGINYRLKEIENLLQIIDYELFVHLRRNKVKLEFYGFRWMTLFFTQNFEMPDIMRLWDSIFSDPEIFEFLYLLILAPLIIKRKEILEEKIAGIMMIIQTLEDISIYDLIKTALRIRNELNKKCR